MTKRIVLSGVPNAYTIVNCERVPEERESEVDEAIYRALVASGRTVRVIGEEAPRLMPIVTKSE